MNCIVGKQGSITCSKRGMDNGRTGMAIDRGRHATDWQLRVSGWRLNPRPHDWGPRNPCIRGTENPFILGPRIHPSRIHPSRRRGTKRTKPGSMRLSCGGAEPTGRGHRHWHWQRITRDAIPCQQIQLPLPLPMPCGNQESQRTGAR